MHLELKMVKRGPNDTWLGPKVWSQVLGPRVVCHDWVPMIGFRLVPKVLVLRLSHKEGSKCWVPSFGQMDGSHG